MTETAEAPATPPPTLWSLGLRPLDDRAPGPLVTRLFTKGFAILWAIAWCSLGAQVIGLIGERGLLPLAEGLASVPTDRPLRFVDFPSVFLWGASDTALRLSIAAGLVFSVAVFLEIWPLLFLALSTVLYLSFAVACRTFLAFQWDNLLLEAGFVAIFLDTARATRLGPLLVRLLLFKLYFESGLAKWQSPLGDWRDGSAMTFYYETAPLPTPLAFFAHHAPVAWHHVESWATLLIELVGSFFLFGPRLARRLAFVVFTVFQAIDFLTANYGFFCPLAAWLGLFLLGERDVAPVFSALRRRWGHRWTRLPRLVVPVARLPRWLGTPLAGLAAVLWVSLSAIEGWSFFAPCPWESLASFAQPFRLTNTYHLFASVTRERWEPTFAVDEDGSGRFRELALHSKPGPVDRRPPFVAPHQPRVDFQLWFQGLAPNRQPAWLTRLLGALCDDPGSVAWLFTTTPPPHAAAVRLTYWSTHFAAGPSPSPWWVRARERPGPTLACRATAPSR